MKFPCLAVALCAFPVSMPAANFEHFFENRTMRVDYFHTGTATTETVGLDGIYLQGPWAGTHLKLIDTLNLGKYQAKLFDLATNQLIYSRGFASIYGEWETTGEASDEIVRTFHESVLVPLPKMPVQLVLAKRDKWLHYRDIFSTSIDPNSRFVNKESPANHFKVLTLHESGPPNAKVDFLLLGDGYMQKEMSKFRKDAELWKDIILRTSPFKEHADKLNIRAIEVISQDSGIDEPRRNVWKNTALGCSYNSLDSPRYVLTLENRQLRDIAAAAPYDFIFILTNMKRYGGGGIYNLYATGMTGYENPQQDWHMEYMFTHEFGHSFAALGDEYYSSSTAYLDFYPPGVEPLAPNVTALADPENLKWKSFVTEGTPLPTPWAKASYDSLDSIRSSWAKTDLVVNGRRTPEYYLAWDKLREKQVALMQSNPYKKSVGAFEGAGYSSEGLYRPAQDCRMFSRSLAPYDPVCSAAIVRVINFYSE